MAIVCDYTDFVVYLTSPTTIVTVQELVDAIREAEQTMEGFGYAPIIDAVGKAALGGGISTAITMTLNPDWYIEWWDGVTLGTVYGGNVVGGDSNRPIRCDVGSSDTALVLSAEAATIVAVGSGVTEQDKLDIADRVWDEDIDDHTTTGSTGEALDDIDVSGLALEATAQDIKDKTDNLPTDPADQSAVEAAITASEANIRGGSDDLDTLSVQLDAVQLDLDNPDQYKADITLLALEATAQLIKDKTDNLPTDPADQSAVEAAISISESNIRGTDSDDLKTISDQVDVVQTDLDDPDQYKADVTGLALQADLTLMQVDIDFIKAIEGGRWRITGNQMIFYEDDNTTETARFNLYNEAGQPAETDVFQRRRV